MSLEMGVMISQLAGDEASVEAFAEVVGKKIAGIAVVENELLFTFADGTKIALYDNGQSCCENRYMTCDDDLSYFIGTHLCDADVKDGPTINDEYGDPHESQFLVVTTNKGDFTVANHVEHNGYYGGFSIRVKAVA